MAKLHDKFFNRVIEGELEGAPAGTKLYKHVVSVGANYEEERIEFISNNGTQYASSTFNFDGIKNKIIGFTGYASNGPKKTAIAYGQLAGASGEIYFINVTTGAVSSYNLANVTVRSDTVTPL